MKNTCRGRAAAEDSERETGWSDGERWRERANVAAKAGNEGEKRVSQMRERGVRIHSESAIAEV